MDRIAQDAIAEQRLEGPAIHHVGGAIEKLVDVELQPRVFEDAYRPLGIEFYQDVDIAVHASLPTRDRAEDRSVRDSQPPQLVFVRPQRFEHVVQNSGHGMSVADSRKLLCVLVSIAPAGNGAEHPNFARAMQTASGARSRPATARRCQDDFNPVCFFRLAALPRFWNCARPGGGPSESAIPADGADGRWRLPPWMIPIRKSRILKVRVRKRAKALLADSERAELVAFLGANPEAGAVMPETGGVHLSKTERNETKRLVPALIAGYPRGK